MWESLTFSFLLSLGLFCFLYFCDKAQSAITTCSERRLFNLNELTFFKNIDYENSVTFYKVLYHENHKYDYHSYYYLYYESVRLFNNNGTNYEFKSKDYRIIKDADEIVCSERDNFLNNAIPITEEEYNKVKQDFLNKYLSK